MRLHFVLNLLNVLKLLAAVDFVVDIGVKSVNAASSITNINPSASSSMVTAAISSVAETAYCTDRNWTQYKSSCYKVFSTFDYFTTAERICKDNGALLVTISDAEENKVVENLIAANTRYKEAWIGLKLNTKTNKYEWVDKKTQLQYKNWLFEKYRSEGDCTELIPGGTWSNVLCYNKLQFVCERGVKTATDDKQTTKIIIMITIPLACVSIMMMFVGYLCFRSHQEIKALPEGHRKCSQHFVDVASNIGSIGTENLTIPLRKTSEQAQTTRADTNSDSLQEEPIDSQYRGRLQEKTRDEKYTERKKRTYTSSNGSEKMYKQVTFV